MIRMPLARAMNALLPGACLLMPAMLTAQIDRSKAPVAGPAPTTAIGDHVTFQLDNGMRVIVVENHKLPMVSVQLRFDIEPFLQGELAGYTDLAGELLASGTPRHTKQQIDETVDGLGASLHTSSDGLYASCLTKHFDKLFPLIFEITTSAIFPPQEFEKAKKRMLSSIKSRQDDPDAIAEQVARTLTFSKGHPYGEVVTEASVEKVQRKHVYAYYQRFFQPRDGYLVFVGDITEPKARDLALRTFGIWQGAAIQGTTDAEGNEVVDGLGAIRTTSKPPVAGGPRRVAFVDRPGSAQSVIRVVFPVHLHPWDADALDAQVLNTILGGGVFNARLMQNLREDKAYTYGAHSELAADRWAGHFSASFSVRNAVTDSAITEALFEIENMQLKEVTDAELDLAKSYLAGSFARSLEDPRTIARFVLSTYLNQLPPDHYKTYLRRLDTVSAGGVLAAAKKFLKPDNAAILVVGDKEEVANGLAVISFDQQVLYLDNNGDRWKEAAEPAPPGVTAESVIEAYLTACGGRGAISAIKDLSITMEGSMMGQPVTMTQHYGFPNKYASETRSGYTVMEKTVFDGARGKSTGPMGEKELVDLDLEYILQNAYPFPEMHYADFHHKLVLGGIVETLGKKTYKITGLTENGGIFYEYYDTQTGFKVRRVEPRVTEQGHLTTITTLKDYRPEGGVQFPRLVEQNVGIDLVFTVTEIKVNKGSPAGAFVVE